MTSNLEKMREIVSQDKRVCERLDLPMAIRYSKFVDASGEVVKWSDLVTLDNIGGEGLGFSDDFELLKGEKINVELKLPCQLSPVYLGAEVVWVSRNFQPDADGGGFSYGLKIFKLSDDDQKKFQQFISDRIIDKYLDDQGKLRDIES